MIGKWSGCCLLADDKILINVTSLSLKQLDLWCSFELITGKDYYDRRKELMHNKSLHVLSPREKHFIIRGMGFEVSSMALLSPFVLGYQISVPFHFFVHVWSIAECSSNCLTVNRYFGATTGSPLLSTVLNKDLVSILINDLSVARRTVPIRSVRTVPSCQVQMRLKTNTERALAGWNTFYFKLPSMTAVGAWKLEAFPLFSCALPLFGLLKAEPCKHPASLLGKG